MTVAAGDESAIRFADIRDAGDWALLAARIRSATALRFLVDDDAAALMAGIGIAIRSGKPDGDDKARFRRKKRAKRKTPRKTGAKNFASRNGDEPLAPHGIAAGKRVADAHREVKLLAADWRGNVDHWGGIAATGDANIVREHGSLRP